MKKTCLVTLIWTSVLAGLNAQNTEPVEVIDLGLPESSVTSSSTEGSGQVSPPSDLTATPVEAPMPQPTEAVAESLPVETPAVSTEAAKPAVIDLTDGASIPTLDLTNPDSGELPTMAVNSTDAPEEQETIQVDFPDAEVKDIIRSVAQLYDLNVVIPDSLSGRRSSISLSNVTWQQVFQVLLEPLRYTYTIDKNIIKIRSLDEVEAEPKETRVFPVNYAKASNLSGSIGPLIDSANGGRIQVDERTNSLIVTERPSMMNQIQIIIDRLDKATDQVMIESKFIEVSDGDTRNLGLDWSSLNNYQLFGVEGLQRNYDKTSGQERETVKQNTSDVNTLRTTSQGFTLGGAQPVTDSNVTTVTDDQTSLVDDTVTDTSNVARTTTAVFSAGDFQLLLSLLQSNTDSRVVTNPTVVTLDGEEAKITIGQKYPIPNYQYNNERGSFEVAGFNFEDIGVVMSVRPQVNSAGFIRLEVLPEISNLEGTVAFSAAAASIPVIGTTETKSTVTLKDGYTLAIGGLLQSSSSNTDTSVPFLKDLPLIGRLFQRKSDVYTETNLIIFITARTLNPDGTTYREIVDPRMLARMKVTDSEIPGYQIPEEELELMKRIDEMRARHERVSNIEKAKSQAQLLEQALQRKDPLGPYAAEEAKKEVKKSPAKSKAR